MVRTMVDRVRQESEGICDIGADFVPDRPALAVAMADPVDFRVRFFFGRRRSKRGESDSKASTRGRLHRRRAGPARSHRLTNVFQGGSPIAISSARNLLGKLIAAAPSLPATGRRDDVCGNEGANGVRPKRRAESGTTSVFPTTRGPPRSLGHLGTTSVAAGRTRPDHCDLWILLRQRCGGLQDSKSSCQSRTKVQWADPQQPSLAVAGRTGPMGLRS